MEKKKKGPKPDEDDLDDSNEDPLRKTRKQAIRTKDAIPKVNNKSKDRGMPGFGATT